MSYFIGNSRTRESLKCAFEELFEKYGRPFSDDDEIDLTTMSLVKQGSHLSGQRKKLKFGSIFTKHTRADPSDFDETEEESSEKEAVDEQLVQPVRKKLAKCLLSLERKKKRPNFTGEFDQTLYDIFKPTSLPPHPCKCSVCFNCVLYSVMIK